MPFAIVLPTLRTRSGLGKPPRPALVEVLPEETKPRRSTRNASYLSDDTPRFSPVQAPVQKNGSRPIVIFQFQVAYPGQKSAGLCFARNSQ
jgi:hypothetical protein